MHSAFGCNCLLPKCIEGLHCGLLPVNPCLEVSDKLFYYQYFYASTTSYRGDRHCVVGSSVCLLTPISGDMVPLYQCLCTQWRDSIKLGTNIYHVSGHYLVV